MLLEAIKKEGVAGLTLLDIGGGVGAIQHALLDAGVEQATDVDASSAYLDATRTEAQRRGLAPLARIVAHTTHAQEPGWFTTAPVAAIRKLYDKTGWKPGDVDLYEINEAFAVVTMAAMKEHGLPHGKVNVHGGACALGHPIGASGARILVTLLGALRKHGMKRGVASLCIGGGEATAMAVEMVVA
jgi:acetyl-CoA C-acetyltransferase